MWIGLVWSALAAPHGLVVHLNLGTATTETVQVVLSGEGDPKTLTLKDDGVSPDVTAGDGMYSGTSMVQSDTVTVKVLVGDHAVQGGAVSWDPSQTVCDLNLKMDGDNLTAEAAVPLPPTPQQPNSPASSGPASGPVTGPAAGTSVPGPTGDATTAPLQAPVVQPLGNGGGSSPSPAAPTPSSDSTATLSIVAGGGFLLLAALLYLGWSGGGSLLSPLPEPGLLGPNTPSLSAGLSAWEVSPEDSRLFANLLVATLARQHRVLLLVPPDFSPDPVFGGPVYRAPARPASWKKQIQGLLEEGGLPLVVLSLGGDPAILQKNLPEGMGGVLVGSGAGLPTVRCLRDGSRWHLQTEGGLTLVLASSKGLEPDF